MLYACCPAPYSLLSCCCMLALTPFSWLKHSCEGTRQSACSLQTACCLQQAVETDQHSGLQLPENAARQFCLLIQNLLIKLTCS